MARAVYSKAEILLLDDVLAALDVHTAKWIVEKCFQGDLIRGRTVLLVTHNVAMTSSIAEFIVSMGNNGQILSQGSLSKALAKDKKLSKELKEEAKQIEKIEHEVDAVEPAEGNKKTDGKLIVAEEIEEGHVGWPARASLSLTPAVPVPADAINSQDVVRYHGRRSCLGVLELLHRSHDHHTGRGGFSYVVPWILGSPVRGP